MKNKYFIIVLILIVGLIVNFGITQNAFSGGGGSDSGGMDCSPGDTAPSSQANSMMGNGTTDGDDHNGGGGNWDYPYYPTTYYHCSGCSCQSFACDPDHDTCVSSCSSNANCCPSPSVTLTTWPTFELPDPVSLNWNSSNANSCVASLDWSGSKAMQGQESLDKPRGSYSFTLTCSGSGGSAFATANTKVIQVPKCSFVANPVGIIPPQSSTLSWACQYADSCSIDNNIGSVDNVSGNTPVRPTKTTTYTLDCTAPDGSRSYQATVNVGFLPWLREILPR